ncbi:hypothetical protein PIROE2DRAFT_57212 [Piromyces sp. E2]|nr:hypothetical protein PIROE2DRAFT_57212 [Piromyces sp. E2]|eukprot:OUM69802.1 hypothetical protein PIROE2DRAFT_57212 [Piromyces sp. E2]
MKFSTLFCAFIAAVNTVYALQQGQTVHSNKTVVTEEETTSQKEVADETKEETNSYTTNETLSAITKNKGDTSVNCILEVFNQNHECVFNKETLVSTQQMCNVYFSDKCQQSYKNFETNIAKCINGTKEARAEAIKAAKIENSILDIMCNGDNRTCPFFNPEYLGTDEMGINETCKSYSCTRVTKDVLELTSEIEKVDSASYKDVNIDKPFDVKDAIGGDKYVCSTYKSDKCQQFYSTFTTESAKCNNELQDKKEFVTNLVYENKRTLDAICEEENKKCPFFQKEYKDRVDQAINDTCKSKYCIFTTIKAVEFSSNSTKILKGFDALRGRVIDKPYNSADSIDHDYNSYMSFFLKSKYCNAQSSDAAATMKYSMVAILLAIAYALF